MSPNEKVAAARVISDIIKADSIIEKSEMEKLRSLGKKFGIQSEHLQKGQGMTFSEALAILRNMDQASIDDFLRDLYDLSLSDGNCCPKEAQLIVAIKYCLEEGLKDHAETFSCNTKDFNIVTDQYVVYVESRTETAMNKEIKDNLARIVNAFKGIGFDFIYIPKLVDEFKEMSPEYVKDVIHYMAPQLDREKAVPEIYKRMCNLSTYEFCQKVLCEENRIDAIRDTEPSLLVSVGNSIVPYVDATGSCHTYMEFLKIGIKGNVIDEVRRFHDIFQDLVSEYTIRAESHRKDRFKYFGFYKALLDFLVSGKNNEESKFLIDFQARMISIQNRPGIYIKLSRDKMLMLFLIVHQSVFADGLSFAKGFTGRIERGEGLEKVVDAALRISGAPDFSKDKKDAFFDNFSVTLAKLKKDLVSEKQLPELSRLIPTKKVVKGETRDEITYKAGLEPEMIMVKDYVKNESGAWVERFQKFIPITEMLLK